MAHQHENCLTPKPEWVHCTEGRSTSECSYEYCDNPWCSDLGHCECLCHSGKICGCGYSWPKMLKKNLEETT